MSVGGGGGGGGGSDFPAFLSPADHMPELSESDYYFNKFNEKSFK